MPLAITAHENKQIRLFDLNSSISLASMSKFYLIVKCVKSAVAHTDGVTCLLAKDFTLVSGGHDGSIRFWDLRKMQLLYELPVLLLFC
jgi:WD40 repeat protein